MTERQKRLVDHYNKATAKSISEIYNSPSMAKQIVENDIKEEMQRLNGYGYRVLSYNKFVFTCAYRIGENTLVCHFPSNREVIEL